MNGKINFSIIIPHKNTPILLQRCLDSIPRRDDIQIIIVDDNSDYKTVNFENFPGINDSFAETIFLKESKGAGFARNEGLKRAKGKWILFADADDYFTVNFIMQLDKYTNSDFDLIYFGIYRLSKKSNTDFKYETLMNDATKKGKYDAYKYTAYVPWGKMIKLSLIKENNILFDNTIVANDRLFSLKTAYNAKNIHFDEHKIYTYVPENGHLTKLKSADVNFERFTVYLSANRFLEGISKSKYKTNLIPSLRKLIKLQNMKHFRNAIKLMKENNTSLVFELFKFCFLLPSFAFNKALRRSR